jgi:hypothetical protein
VALSAAVGGFNLTASSSTGTDTAVTGVGFTPSLVFLWGTGRTETSDTAAFSDTVSALPTFGMFNAAGEQYAWGTGAADAADTMVTEMIHRTDSCFISGNVNGDYRAQVFVSMDGDGFTIEISANGGNAVGARRVHYLALGGGTLTNTKIGTVTVTGGATGNEAFTPLAFQPAALVFAVINAATNAVAANVAATLGAATGASNQWTWSGQDLDNSATTEANSYMRTDECGGTVQANGASLDRRNRFVSMDATGFTVNRLENSAGNWTQPYCAIAGPNVKAGTFNPSSGGGSISGLGFQPKAILFVSHGIKTENAADTPTAEYALSIGASVGTGGSITQRYGLDHSGDNLALANTPTAIGNDGVVVGTSNLTSVTTKVAISSHDSDGFTYTMPVSTNSGQLVGYLALGEAPVAATSRTFCAGMIG